MNRCPVKTTFFLSVLPHHRSDFSASNWYG